MSLDLSTIKKWVIPEGEVQSVTSRHNAELCTVCTDYANFLVADLFVYLKFLFANG